MLVVSRGVCSEGGEYQIRCIRNFFFGFVVLLFLGDLPGGLSLKDNFCGISAAGQDHKFYKKRISATKMVRMLLRDIKGLIRVWLFLSSMGYRPAATSLLLRSQNGRC